MSPASTISVSPTTVREAPALDGLDTVGAEWRLDPTRYEAFIQAATGFSVTDELSADDCYRIRNRLEALIAERRQHDEWNDALVEEFPNIDRLEEITGLALFFRECHACHRPDAPT